MNDIERKSSSKKIEPSQLNGALLVRMCRRSHKPDAGNLNLHLAFIEFYFQKSPITILHK